MCMFGVSLCLAHSSPSGCTKGLDSSSQIIVGSSALWQLRMQILVQWRIYKLLSTGSLTRIPLMDTA